MSRAPEERRGSGSKMVALLAGGAAVVGVGGYLALRTDPEDVDDDGDGFSENEGDCDDANATLRPRGPVSAAIRSTVGGTVHCTTGQNLTLTVTNNSCTPLTISSIMERGVVLSGSCSTSLRTHSPSQGTVAPGQSSTVWSTRWNYSGCRRSFSTTVQTCAFRAEFSLVTNSGLLGAGSFSYGVQYDSRCPICPSGTAASSCGVAEVEPDM